MVHRADRLDDVLAALKGRFGGVVVHPLWPKAGVPAKRVIVHAAKQSRAPLTVTPGLVLHTPDGGYTPEVDAALGGAALDLGQRTL